MNISTTKLYKTVMSCQASKEFSDTEDGHIASAMSFGYRVAFSDLLRELGIKITPNMIKRIIPPKERKLK